MARKPSPEKREQFLQAALRLFARKGFQNTSTAEIAREAGTATGTLFLYFPTKQALMDELVVKLGSEQSKFIQGLLSPGMPAREIFWQIWNGTLRWFLDHSQAYQYIQQVWGTQAISPAAVQESAKDLAYYATAIQKGLEEGSVGKYPPELIGTLLYHDIVAVMTVLASQPVRRHKELIQSGFEIFWKGIKSGR
jgi:AcrR family transcriptional regulator